MTTKQPTDERRERREPPVREQPEPPTKPDPSWRHNRKVWISRRHREQRAITAGLIDKTF